MIKAVVFLTRLWPCCLWNVAVPFCAFLRGRTGWRGPGGTAPAREGGCHRARLPAAPSPLRQEL